MSPRYAYVGCYSGYEPGQLGWVGSRTPGRGILTFAMDTETGRLTATGHLAEQTAPTWLEVHPNKRFLVATHEVSHHTGAPAGVGFVSSYILKPDGSLEKICTQPSGGWGNTCATFDRTGRFLLVTRYWDGGVTVLPFDPDTGAIGAITEKLDYTGAGPHPTRQSSPHPHGIHGDPETDRVYVMDLGTDMVHQHVLDRDTGTLTLKDDVAFAPMSGPRGISFHPRLRVAYVNCELDGTVVVCAIDDAAGLVPQQTAPCYPEDFDGQEYAANLGQARFWGAEGCLSADGNRYFYLCRVHQSIAVFDVDTRDGSLSYDRRQALVEGSNARNLTVDPSGQFLLVASQDADCVECFEIDAENAPLSRIGNYPAPCAADVAVV